MVFYNFIIKFITLIFTFYQFLLLDTKNISFDGFHLVSFQMYHPHLPQKKLLIIFEVFVYDLIT